MSAYEIIFKKREGLELNSHEINYMIEGYTQGTIPDYQMAAWAMAVYFQGMSAQETTHLTLAMAHSGDVLDLSSIPGLKFDKHSTGGVGDKITLVLGPLAAAAGLTFAKMSGRGLGHTGGTVDKLESIPGFRTALTNEEFLRILDDLGVVLAGQTGNLVPADKKLYALRDVTGTVESAPLIASSVMSKKIAAGADGILLDVKVGSGAFMKTEETALELAELCVKIGEGAGRRVVAYLTDMSQPLGYAVGNILEVQEAIQVLKGEGPEDVRELSIVFASAMLHIAEKVDMAQARAQVEELLYGGQALEKFALLVKAQGGDPSFIYDPSKFDKAPFILELPSPRGGYIRKIDAQGIGLASVSLGAGRVKKGDPIDPRVGICLKKKMGDKVEPGEPLAIIHGRTDSEVHQVGNRLYDCYDIAEEPVESPPVILGSRI
jgi:pyrimidine-nucleoside phosphorylase